MERTASSEAERDRVMEAMVNCGKGNRADVFFCNQGVPQRSGVSSLPVPMYFWKRRSLSMKRGTAFGSEIRGERGWLLFRIPLLRL